MSYREGVDYWVRELEFPNRASPSVAVSNGDGTFTIFLNTLFSREKRLEGLRHELRHLEREHFYRDDNELWELEEEAGGKLTLAAPRKTVSNGERSIPLYEDADDVLREFLRVADRESLELVKRAGLAAELLPDEQC